MTSKSLKEFTKDFDLIHKQSITLLKNFIDMVLQTNDTNYKSYSDEYFSIINRVLKAYRGAYLDILKSKPAEGYNLSDLICQYTTISLIMDRDAQKLYALGALSFDTRAKIIKLIIWKDENGTTRVTVK